MITINDPVICLEVNSDVKQKAVKCSYTKLATFDQASNTSKILVKTELTRSQSTQKRICREIIKVYQRFGIIAQKVSYHPEGCEVYQLQPN